MAIISEQTLMTPMLAFTRSIENTEGMMYGRKSDNLEYRVPVEVVEKGVRGQSSHAKAKKGEAFNPGLSNPQVVDVAMLPPGCDILEISFHTTFLGNSLKASSSDSNVVRGNLSRLVGHYVQSGGFAVLAERYIGQIATGRFAWRNRTVTKSASVTVTFEGKTIKFDPYKLSLETVPTLEEIKFAATVGAEEVEGLIDHIRSGLEGSPASINVVWLGQMNENSEVYPSQEYVRKGAERTDVSKTLSTVNRTVGGRTVRCATLHTQKIGAAIRCIDDWHEHEEFYGLPVPVNPYAGVQEANVALRYGTGAKSFFDIARKPKDIWETAESGQLSDDLHFYVANLVRGGVYGEKAD